jgi:uncharacterized membrane protein YwaF
MPPLCATPFHPHGPSHTVVLALFGVAAILVVALGRRCRSAAVTETFSRVFAVLILLVCGGLQIDSMLPEHWDIGTSLPFQLCDLAWMAATTPSGPTVSGRLDCCTSGG